MSKGHGRLDDLSSGKSSTSSRSSCREFSSQNGQLETNWGCEMEETNSPQELILIPVDFAQFWWYFVISLLESRFNFVPTIRNKMFKLYLSPIVGTGTGLGCDFSWILKKKLRKRTGWNELEHFYISQGKIPWNTLPCNINLKFRRVLDDDYHPSLTSGPHSRHGDTEEKRSWALWHSRSVLSPFPILQLLMSE